MNFDSSSAFAFFLVVTVIVGVVWWRIFAKAGYPPWMGLFVLVPLVNVAVLLYLAFSDWPVHRELRALRARGEGQVDGGAT